MAPLLASLWAPLLASFLALNAQAQGAGSAPERRADPMDPQATVPALVYRSSLKPAGAAAADKAIPWRDANDAVARIGGWRVYAREAQQAAEPAATPSPSSQAPTPPPVPAPAAPAGHSGHKMP